MANSSTEAGWRCLVADDHTLVRELLVRMLRRHMDGIAIREAGSLAEVESACAEGLDLALLDLGMPGMAGAESVAALVRSNPQLRVVVLTAADDPAVVAAVRKAGASAFVQKSTASEVLLDIIRDVMAGGRHFPELAAAEPPPEAGLSLASLPLTERQREVLDQLVQGKANKEIARALGMAVPTVKIHIRQILRALGASNRLQAALLVQQASRGGRQA